MKTRVLVVDDEKDFAHVLAERLELQGYATDVCFGGAEAQEKVINGEYDVVVLDLMMPAPDGITTLKQIKHHKPIVEVIMLSGQATRQMAIEGMMQGAFEYLTKPCDNETMVFKINEAHRRKREQEERIRKALEEVGRANRQQHENTGGAV